ncbi:hypothetical protein WEU32_05175 [Brevundimonas sp. BH3]|uniref:hypothetical protein n=1 Tax=Brevundimonas sp. BH3 TaxID=3133089 RepID=UPI00324EBB2C
MAQVVRSMSMSRDTDPPQGKPKRTSKALAVVVVGLTHVVLGLWLGHLAPEVETEEPLQAIAVDLVRPVPPPMPEPLPASPKEGGGAAAAKSAVRPTPPREKMPPPEIEAPPVTSSEPPLVIGVAEKESVRPGQGQGEKGAAQVVAKEADPAMAVVRGRSSSADPHRPRFAACIHARLSGAGRGGGCN